MIDILAWKASMGILGVEIDTLGIKVATFEKYGAKAMFPIYSQYIGISTVILRIMVPKQMEDLRLEQANPYW